MQRRAFARLWAAATGAAIVPALMPEAGAAQSPAPAAQDEKLQSEFLLDLVLEKGTANRAGSHLIVPVLSGTFNGPKLRGTVAAPAGDWITVRPDGSSVIDLRLPLQTDDGQNVYLTARGIAYTQPDGALFARILPAFETGAANYAWLNNVVAVGVYRQVPGRVAYRVYRIL